VFYLIALYSLEANNVNLSSRVIKSLERHYSAIRELYLYIYSNAKLPLIRVLP
jgi:hypothetical protein